jgi:hypothetical protein
LRNDRVSRGGGFMDALFLLLIIGFFVATWAFVRLCEKV